jgi:hypothetical protein
VWGKVRHLYCILRYSRVCSFSNLYVGSDLSLILFTTYNLGICVPILHLFIKNLYLLLTIKGKTFETFLL